MGAKLYKIFSLVVTILAGVVSNKLLAKVWPKAARQQTAPAATDEDRRMREILTAAVLQGAIAAAIKAGMNRGGAKSIRKMTGTWPA